ncbi:MAG TPA: filamentous hemagglutinin N-terminal domain-containing protein, partial [Sphingomicrobium sp.]|nr:filamentous hemagglutinin N-terminal domain-containing protein [Sphingomicrobium sp.]
MLKRFSLCSSLAIATSLVAGPSPAAAQSFNADTIAPVTTNGAIVSTSPGFTNVALNGGQTVIDWTPNDTAISGSAIDFQSGGTATFSSASDFAVLNRINPTDPTRLIVMNGTINSLVGSQTGGSVFFYTPGGIVLGPNALINVGSLVLATSLISVDGSGQFIGGVDGTSVTFGSAAAGSKIVTASGSTINALNQGSYVAMVAPRVEHNGAINVNGAAALVGAEGATINFRAGGLFDIQIDTGTTDPNGVAIGDTGVITGNASTGYPDLRRAYLVAVPKNTALTMLISGG